MLTGNLIFGSNNYISQSETVLSSNIDPVTSLDSLRNSFQARQTRYTNLSGDIVIGGELDQVSLAAYFAIAGSNLSPFAEVRLEVFETATATTPLYDSQFQRVINLAGGGVEPVNNTILFLFPERLLVRRFQLTIKHGLDFVPPPEPIVAGEELSLIHI